MAVGKIKVIRKFQRPIYALFDQHLVLGTANDKVIFDRNVPGFSCSRADVEVDPDLAVVASVVIDLVPGIVGHDTAAQRVIVDNVVENLVALTRDVVGEDPVAAVVVYGVVADGVMARPKGRLARVDRKLDAGEAGVVTVVFLHDIRARAGQSDAISFAAAGGVGIGVSGVAGDQRIVGLVKINPRSVVVNGVPRNPNASHDQTVRVNDRAAALGSRAADDEDAIEKLPVTPGPVIPAREQLGDLLLQQGQPKEALKEFQISVSNSPKRRGAMIGFSRASEGLGMSASHY